MNELSNIENWERTGMLKGVENLQLKTKLANALENQRIFNNSEPPKQTEDVELDFKAFKRLTIPLVSRFIKEFVFFDLVSWDVLTGPVGKLKYKDLTTNAIKDMEIAAKTRWLRLRWNQSKLNELCDKSQTRLDGECEFLNEFSEDFHLDIQKEIYHDLSNNSGSVSEIEWKNINNLVDVILIKSSSIEKKIGRSANWIIIPNEIYLELKNSNSFELKTELNSKSLRLQKVGKLSNKWDVYVNPIAEDLEIILGYKEESNTGYMYCPYVLACPIMDKVPVGEDFQTEYSMSDPLPTDHTSIVGRINEYAMLTRFGKKLINKDNYAKILISGYSFSKK